VIRSPIDIPFVALCEGTSKIQRKKAGGNKNAQNVSTLL
jgi:hypothetical protein